MSLSKRVLIVWVMAWTVSAWGQANPRAPHVGYVYPAGGQQGATIQIIAGGQQLNNVSGVYISGDGVQATAKYSIRPTKRLENDERKELARRIAQRRAVLNGGAATTSAPTSGASDSVELPNHPLIRDLDSLNPKELELLEYGFLSQRPKQANAQIAERILLDVTIDPAAAPGDRELRLKTSAGLTNPVRFQVGTLPELYEQEPNDRVAAATPASGAAIALPAILNGQIGPGDSDRFRVQARKGQRLVIAAHARSLTPYLADAVPGWFQATLTLYDMKNNELAFDDDYRFDPDPVMFYTVPDDGDYELEIRDSIYRGREDFVYRIAIGELPFITQMFPLGGQTGNATLASIEGWNLPTQVLPLDTTPGGDAIRQAVMRKDTWVSNPVLYAVDSLPECDESEPNDTAREAQPVTIPQVINGRIGQPGDVDMVRIEGSAGSEVVAEVFARRLLSPMDSLLQLTDTSGKILAWNDDTDDKGSGLLTHQADSYVRAKLPKDGTYLLRVSDTQRHGGPEYAYRLAVSAPRPDFALRVTPSSLNLLTGRATVVTVYALRRDGFDGPIDIAMKDSLAGFTVNGGRIPRGSDHVRMTITAPMKRLDQPVALALEGQAQIADQTVKRPVVPAEDMMQAFLYRSLVPSQGLLAMVTGPNRQGRPIEMAGDAVHVPEGGAAEVRFRAQGFVGPADAQLQLDDPPKGITLEDVKVDRGSLAFTLKADGATAKAGLADNLIVEAFAERARQGKNAGPGDQKQRVLVGVLPAVPFEVVPKQ